MNRNMAVFTMLNDLVQVCLPTRNGQQHLAEALDSLLGQTHQNIEVTIVDNASTDRTPAIARSYAARDRRVQYIRCEEFVCASDNWNRAFSMIDRSRSEFFMWASDDDIWDEEFVSELLGRLVRSPEAVLSFCNYRKIDGGGLVLVANCFKTPSWESRSPLEAYMWLMQRGGGHCALYGIIRQAAIDWTPVIQHSTFGADLWVLIKLAACGRLTYCEKQLFSKRLGGVSTTGADPSVSLDHGEIWNVGPAEWQLINALKIPRYTKYYLFWRLKVFAKIYIPSKRIEWFLWLWYAVHAIRRNKRSLGVRTRLRSMIVDARNSAL